MSWLSRMLPMQFLASKDGSKPSNIALKTSRPFMTKIDVGRFAGSKAVSFKQKKSQKMFEAMFEQVHIFLQKKYVFLLAFSI